MRDPPPPPTSPPGCRRNADSSPRRWTAPAIGPGRPPRSAGRPLHPPERTGRERSPGRPPKSQLPARALSPCLASSLLHDLPLVPSVCLHSSASDPASGSLSVVRLAVSARRAGWPCRPPRRKRSRSWASSWAPGSQSPGSRERRRCKSRIGGRVSAGVLPCFPLLASSARFARASDDAGGAVERSSSWPLLRGPELNPEQVVRRDAEDSAQPSEQQEAGEHAAGLVPADRPVVGTDGLGELLLGEVSPPAGSRDALPDQAAQVVLGFLLWRTCGGFNAFDIVDSAIHGG